MTGPIQNRDDLMASNVIRVTVPVKVANDLDAIQRVQKDILGELGCQACCSGWDIRFDVARRFLVSEDLQIQSFGPGGL
jgi:hypothetical protein